MKVKQILVCFAMVHGLSAYAAVNTGYQEATVMSSKLRFFYDSYNQTDKIIPSSWYSRNISVGSTTISTKELAAATDATNALKKVVIDSTVQVYGLGGYTRVDLPYVGNDAKAALFAKTLMSTDKKILASTWKKGVQVKKNDQTLVGKVIAIFGTDGTYKNDDNSHVAIVLSVSANDITVINQNANVSAKSTDGIIRKHSLSFSGKKDALDAASYNVVELKVPVPAKSPLGLPVPTGAQFKSLNIPQKINLHDVWNVTLETTEFAKSVVLTLPDVNQKLQLVPSNNNTKWTLPRYTVDKAGTMRQYFVDVFDKNNVRTAAIGNYLYVDTISKVTPIFASAPTLPASNAGGHWEYANQGTTFNQNGTINAIWVNDPPKDYVPITNTGCFDVNGMMKANCNALDIQLHRMKWRDNLLTNIKDSAKPYANDFWSHVQLGEYGSATYDLIPIVGLAILQSPIDVFIPETYEGTALAIGTIGASRVVVELAKTPKLITTLPKKTPVPVKYISSSPVNFDHVIGADFGKLGKPTGGHSLLNGDVQIVKIVNKSNSYGVYEAEVKLYDPIRKDWFAKTANNSKNTMFPKDWAKDRIKMEVDVAWNNKKVSPKGKWEAKTPSGVNIEGWIDGEKVTAYPIYNTQQ
jgi:hypothetical protein